MSRSRSRLAADWFAKLRVNEQTQKLEHEDIVTVESEVTTATDSVSTTVNSQISSVSADVATKLDAASYTAEDVLAKVKAVDGSSSGLDADTLDGVQGSSYLRSDTVDAVYGLTTGSGGMWISQKDATNVAIQETNSESSGSTYRAFLRSTNATYTYTLGRLSNSTFGFYGYLNTRTANGTDFGCYMDNSGNWTATGNVTAYSDERLKSNIQTIEGAVDTVKALRGVTFEKDGKASLGVIAQEVQKVLPEVVVEGEEYLSVAYGNIVGLLIEAIKEQQNQIDELKAKLEG